MKCGVFLFATDSFVCYNVSAIADQIRALQSVQLCNSSLKAVSAPSIQNHWENLFKTDTVLPLRHGQPVPEGCDSDVLLLLENYCLRERNQLNENNY